MGERMFARLVTGSAAGHHCYNGVDVTSPPQETLFARTRPVDLSAATLSIDAVRFGFQALFDEALHEVLCRGYDLDNVVFERMLDCRVGDRDVCVAASFVSTQELLADCIEKGVVAETGQPYPTESIHIFALRVVAVRHTVF